MTSSREKKTETEVFNHFNKEMRLQIDDEYVEESLKKQMIDETNKERKQWI